VIAALRQRFPAIQGPRRDDICYATQNRQDAVKQLARQSDLVLVVGSINSSNSNRLRELAERSGCEAHLIDSADDVNLDWLQGKQQVGITAGASAPEVLVRQVIEKLESLGARQTVEVQGQPENVHFSLPVELRSQK
jgi:4-hydroxy-3-methylbut-2-enyl diphosphate reductase